MAWGFAGEETVFLGQYRHFFDQMARSAHLYPFVTHTGLRWAQALVNKAVNLLWGPSMCCSGSNASSMLTPANAGSACSRCKRSLVSARFPEFGLDLSAVCSNDLMGGLSIRTVANRGHQQCFGSQERHLSHQVGAAYRWVGD